MIRIAKIFNGSKNKVSYYEELQYETVTLNAVTGEDMKVWKKVETVWASKEDEEKYNMAAHREYLKNPI